MKDLHLDAELGSTHLALRRYHRWICYRSVSVSCWTPRVVRNVCLPGYSANKADRHLVFGSGLLRYDMLDMLVLLLLESCHAMAVIPSP